MRHASRWVVLGCLLPMMHIRAAAPPPVPADQYGDLLPPGAVARMGTLRFAHAGFIESAEFAPDGKTILSFGTDDTFRVWETATGRQLQSWPRQGFLYDNRSAVAFSSVCASIFDFC